MPAVLPANWKVVLAYDGGDFSGWQVQPGLVTVQGELANAIERTTGERVLPQGSGRTDAGVHALGQVASFTLSAPIPPANLQRALNRTLPESVRVLSAETACPDFHARHSAIGKCYEYRIWRGDLCPPWQARYVYAFPAPLAVEAMRQAAQAVLGEHDFTSFAATDPDRGQRTDGSGPDPGPVLRTSQPRNLRTIRSSEWLAEPEMLIYRVSGSGFLHHMVRNLVGTFLNVGRGLTPPGSMAEILAARSRQRGGPTAPARGLFLVSVEYPSPAG